MRSLLATIRLCQARVQIILISGPAKIFELSFDRRCFGVRRYRALKQKEREFSALNQENSTGHH